MASLLSRIGPVLAARTSMAGMPVRVDAFIYPDLLNAAMAHQVAFVVAGYQVALTRIFHSRMEDRSVLALVEETFPEIAAFPVLQKMRDDLLSAYTPDFTAMPDPVNFDVLPENDRHDFLTDMRELSRAVADAGARDTEIARRAVEMACADLESSELPPEAFMRTGAVERTQAGAGRDRPVAEVRTVVFGLLGRAAPIALDMLGQLPLNDAAVMRLEACSATVAKQRGIPGFL